jgi:radical SAM/Cys-rich protein
MLAPTPSRFEQTLQEKGVALRREIITTLQVNIGKLCNQACHHCHVEAGPKRTEIMERKTVDRLLELLAVEPQIHTVDITGGAPELNPHFRHFVTEIRRMGKEVIDRCNLTVFYEPNQEDTPDFLAANGIQVVASLPCYSKTNVDKQRGVGVFDKSIRAMHRLNALGYGKAGTGLMLHLVYNPVGAFLPPAQVKLEQDYKQRLKNDLDIEFNQLFTITNMPIKRFAHMLERDGLMEQYMQLLIDNFNSKAASGVMCTELVSIGWDGQIYDCDFNQMLDIPINWKPRNIWNIKKLGELDKTIALDNHCFGCTAGAGSSCTGALTE